MAIKTVVVLVIGLALISVHSAEAQQQAKLAKVGWLSPDSDQSNNRFQSNSFESFANSVMLTARTYLSTHDILVMSLTGSLLWPKVGS